MPMKLSKIISNHIQIAVNEELAKYSPKSVRNGHGLSHPVIKTYRHSFDFNTTLPKKIRPEYIIPTTADINKLLEVADE